MKPRTHLLGFLERTGALCYSSRLVGKSQPPKLAEITPRHVRIFFHMPATQLIAQIILQPPIQGSFTDLIIEIYRLLPKDSSRILREEDDTKRWEDFVFLGRSQIAFLRNLESLRDLPVYPFRILHFGFFSQTRGLTKSMQCHDSLGCIPCFRNSVATKAQEGCYDCGQDSYPI